MTSSPSLKDQWYKIDNVQDVFSPALLIYPDRIESNIRKMIDIAGNAGLLRPHVKTHKMAEIIKLQMKYGINKFKCATISEAEMVAEAGAPDVLLAMQPVGPNLQRFFLLKQKYGRTKISCLVDSEEVLLKISEAAKQTGLETHVWLDINNGMNRTGISPDENAVRLFRLIADQPMLKPEGLHVYDGHIRVADLAERKKICDESFKPVMELYNKLNNTTGPLLSVVAGGTPTFPIHAGRNGVELSPGTILLWDYGYGSSFADFDFSYAAVLLTRVVSKPSKNLICLDLGHKAVASEMPQPRIKFLNLDNYDITGHNEEHMVIRTDNADNLKIGAALYGIPYHICPTADRFDTATVIREGKASDEWRIEARKRKITI